MSKQSSRIKQVNGSHFWRFPNPYCAGWIYGARAFRQYMNSNCSNALRLNLNNGNRREIVGGGLGCLRQWGYYFHLIDNSIDVVTHPQYSAVVHTGPIAADDQNNWRKDDLISTFLDKMNP